MKTQDFFSMYRLMGCHLLSRAIYVAAELKVADYLTDSDRTAKELAALIEGPIHENNLYRLLRYLAANDIFTLKENGQFHLNELATCLLSREKGGAGELYCAESFARWQAVGNLIHSIRQGGAGFDPLFQGKDYFSFVNDDANENKRFGHAMEAFSEIENATIAKNIDFSQFKKVMDIGGCKGGLLAAILTEHFNLSGILFDQPEIVKQPDDLIRANVLARCEVLPGDFFTSIPKTTADLVILKRVLHDWNDEKCLIILKNLLASISPNTKVYVIDMIIGHENSDLKRATQDDIWWLTLCDGMERDKNEALSIYQQSGFKLNKIIPLETGQCIAELQA